MRSSVHVPVVLACILFGASLLFATGCAEGEEEGLHTSNGNGSEFGTPNGGVPPERGGVPETTPPVDDDPPPEDEGGNPPPPVDNPDPPAEESSTDNDPPGVATDNPWDNPTPPDDSTLEDGDCNPFEITCDEIPSLVCESFLFGYSNRPVDIVFTIDQSGSMDAEIHEVRETMNAFAVYITTLNVDYHVILVAGVSGSNHVCIPEPLAGPDCTNAERFLQVDQKVASHDALEKTVDHIDEIESFMREKSVRHFVVVTDDTAGNVGVGSGTPAEQFHEFISGRPGYSDYLFHGVIGFNGGSCTQGQGANYIQLAEWTAGLLFDICQANWENLFFQLGETVATATTQFLLEGNPHVSTLSVSIGGAPTLENQHWEYSEVLNGIELIGELPPEDTLIEICYVPAPQSP